jgi:glycosyltransferase involved in cell wall biosynthesis
MANPFFSIVIPAYNAEKFLDESLGSVLSQTFKDYEIIVIDNGSADNTQKKAESCLAGKNVRYSVIREEKNLGIGGARNKAVQMASGEYIAFLDADDVWYPTKLERVHDTFAQNKDISLVCHDQNLARFDESGTKIVGKMVYGPWHDDMYSYLLFDGNCLSVSATTVKKSRLLEAGLFSEKPEFDCVGDYDMWLRVSKICKFYFLHEILGEYRVSKWSTSANIEKQMQTEINVLNSHFSTLQHSKENDKKIRERLAAVYCGGGWYLHRQGNFPESRILYKRAISEYPFLYKAYAAYMLSLLRIRW